MMMQPAHSGLTFTRVHDYHQVEFFIHWRSPELSEAGSPSRNRIWSSRA